MSRPYPVGKKMAGHKLASLYIIIAERLSARQVILQRRPPSQLGFVYIPYMTE